MSTPEKERGHFQEKLRAEVISLGQFCPIDECNPEDCPLYDFRRLKHPEQMLWLNGLSQDELAYLIAYHQIYLNTQIALKTFATDYKTLTD